MAQPAQPRFGLFPNTTFYHDKLSTYRFQKSFSSLDKRLESNFNHNENAFVREPKRGENKFNDPQKNLLNKLKRCTVKCLRRKLLDCLDDISMTKSVYTVKKCSSIPVTKNYGHGILKKLFLSIK
jgi:hypothetical protein